MSHTAVATAGEQESRASRIVSFVLRLVPAVILGQTLFFKLTAAPEAVALFERLGAEPWGRYGSSAFELLAVVLLLWPSRAVYGGLLTVALMSGAILAHLTKLGIAVGDDGGALFAMAIVTFACGALVAWRRRTDLPFVD